MVRIAIAGAAGRMGRQLLKATQLSEKAELGAATERAGSTLVGVDAGELAGTGIANVIIVDDLSKALDDFDVLIDFTAPVATLANIKFCQQHNKKMVNNGYFNQNRKKQDWALSTTYSIR